MSVGSRQIRFIKIAVFLFESTCSIYFHSLLWGVGGADKNFDYAMYLYFVDDFM